MIIPKDWHTHQHYKNRNPPWIKLHKSLLDDASFQRLPVASRALAPMLWLLASEHIGGGITDNISDLAFRLRMAEPDLVAAIKPLIDNGFFSADSEVLADGYQNAIPETEAEKETDKRKRASTTKKKSNTDIPPIPEDALEHLNDLTNGWPRKSAYDSSPGAATTQVRVLRPVDTWEKIWKNKGTDDPKTVINAGLAYLDSLVRPDGKPPTYVINMDNFFGRDRKYVNFVLEES